MGGVSADPHPNGKASLHRRCLKADWRVSGKGPRRPSAGRTSRCQGPEVGAFTGPLQEDCSWDWCQNSIRRC